MPVHASRRVRIALLVLGVVVSTLLLSLAGCAKKKAADPFVPATLGAVALRDTLKDNRLFEIDMPKFDFVHGNTGMIKLGKNLTFIVGTKLEDQYQSWSGARIGVQRMRLPAPHLLIKRVKMGETVTPVDSCASSGVPRLIPMTQDMLATPGANLPSLTWENEIGLQDYYKPGTPLIAVQSQIDKIVRAPLYTLSDPEKAGSPKRDWVWYAVMPKATFQIVPLNSGADWMLAFLASQNKPLYGSFSVVGLEQYGPMQVDRGELGHIVGKLKVNWLKYGNSVVRGGLG